MVTNLLIATRLRTDDMLPICSKNSMRLGFGRLKLGAVQHLMRVYAI